MLCVGSHPITEEELCEPSLKQSRRPLHRFGVFFISLLFAVPALISLYLILSYLTVSYCILLYCSLCSVFCILYFLPYFVAHTDTTYYVPGGNYLLNILLKNIMSCL